MSYDDKLSQILKSAGQIFSEKGYHAASVRDVAAVTGVSPAGLYYYFKSKEELLYLILGPSLATLLDRVKDGISRAGDPGQRLRSIVRTHLRYSQEHRHEMRVLVRDWEALRNSFGAEVRRLMREYANIVIGTFRELSPSRSPREARAAAFGLFGMLSWVDQWYRPEHDLPVTALADRFSGILIDGFLAGVAKGASEEATLPDGGPEEWFVEATKPSILSGPGF